MENICSIIDSTFLKENSNSEFLNNFIQEAIDYRFRLVMIRPEYISLAKDLIIKNKSDLEIGTVIDFPDGRAPLEDKLFQLKKAIDLGSDELDVVINYSAFIDGKFELVTQEVVSCSKFVLLKGKKIKWIIESAALTKDEIKQICVLIRDAVLHNFSTNLYEKVFTKSSTGFYKTKNSKANGATSESVKIMIKNSYPLPVKASGGIRNLSDINEFVKLGVKRIGSSSASKIINGLSNNINY